MELFIGDNMDIEFKNLNELYFRVRPALISKRQELTRSGYNYIKEEDIWNCLREKKWQKTPGLSLSEIINDILNIDNYFIDDYVKQRMDSIPREINVEELES